MQQTINKELVKASFAGGLATYSSEAVVQKAMATELCRLLQPHLPARPLEILEAGCGSGFLTAQLLQTCRIAAYTANDLVLECQPVFAKLTAGRVPHCSFLPGDIETLQIEGKFDLICGNAIFQWLNDAPVFWHRTTALLKPEGLIAITLFGPANFQEIGRLTGTTLNYPKLEAIKDIFSVDYEIIELFQTETTLLFSAGREVLRHIRRTGTGGIKREHWGKKQLLEFEEEYRRHFSTPDGQVTLTYQPIYLLARIKKP